MFKSRANNIYPKKSPKRTFSPCNAWHHISTHFNKGHVQFNATADFRGLRNGPAEKFNKVYFLITTSSVKPLLNTWWNHSSFVWFLHNFTEAKANCITCIESVQFIATIVYYEKHQTMEWLLRLLYFLLLNCLIFFVVSTVSKVQSKGGERERSEQLLLKVNKNIICCPLPLFYLNFTWSMKSTHSKRKWEWSL